MASVQDTIAVHFGSVPGDSALSDFLQKALKQKGIDCVVRPGRVLEVLADAGRVAEATKKLGDVRVNIEVDAGPAIAVPEAAITPLVRDSAVLAATVLSQGAEPCSIAAQLARRILEGCAEVKVNG